MNDPTTKSSNLSGAGELVEAPYMRVVFQKGYPRDVGMNGVRVQDVISLAIERLETYQSGPLACDENAAAILALRRAVAVLDERVRRREEQGLLGTMCPHEAIRTEDEIHEFSATGA